MRQNPPNVAESGAFPACPEATRVDPRVRRTRKLLENALRDLMRERSFDEISVGDIALRATVNRATFYAHFEDKRHLASTMVSEEFHDALLEALAPPAPFEREGLTAFAAAAFEFMARIMGECPKQADEFASTLGTTLQGTLQKVLDHWLDRQPQALRAFPGATREGITSVLSWAIYGEAIRWSRTTDHPAAREAARQTVSLLMR